MFSISTLVYSYMYMYTFLISETFTNINCYLHVHVLLDYLQHIKLLMCCMPSLAQYSYMCISILVDLRLQGLNPNQLGHLVGPCLMNIHKGNSCLSHGIHVHQKYIYTTMCIYNYFSTCTIMYDNIMT